MTSTIAMQLGKGKKDFLNVFVFLLFLATCVELCIIVH